MKIFITTLLLVFLIISCNKEESVSQHSEYLFENILNHNDTIFIESQFQDCGEWGGHKEHIKIYYSEKKILLNYIKYKVNCGNRNNVGQIIQEKDFSKTIVLSEIQSRGIMNYINNLMKLKFISESFGNSGNSFIVKNSTGSLHISNYGSTSLLLNNYNTLMDVLDFQTVRIHH